jgi:hypothetical protein
MWNTVRRAIIPFAGAFVLAFVLVLLGVPKTIVGPAAGVLASVIWVYRSNNRRVTNVSPAERDQLLAQSPPANCGFVYVHRGRLVGGLAVGFNVKLDNVDVALLRAARFTRLVVRPGSHLLVAGPRKQFGQFAQIAEKQTAEASIAITAGETAIFDLKFTKGMILRKLELVREPHAPDALARLAQVKMVLSEPPAG